MSRLYAGGFADIPPDNDILCVVINCAGSLRCGLYPQKGIPTINVLPTWRAGPRPPAPHRPWWWTGTT